MVILNAGGSFQTVFDLYILLFNGLNMAEKEAQWILLLYNWGDVVPFDKVYLGSPVIMVSS